MARTPSVLAIMGCLCVIWLATLPSHGQGRSAEKEDAAGPLEFVANTIDAGIVSEGKEAKAVFVACNKGRVPVRITAVRTSCSCTAGEYSTAPIQPGSEVAITVKANTAGRPGHMQSDILVVYSDGSLEYHFKLVLHVQVSQKGKLIARPSVFHVINNSCGEVISRSFTILPIEPATPPVKITRIDTPPMVRSALCEKAPETDAWVLTVEVVLPGKPTNVLGDHATYRQYGVSDGCHPCGGTSGRRFDGRTRQYRLGRQYRDRGGERRSCHYKTRRQEGTPDRAGAHSLSGTDERSCDVGNLRRG
ncbi:MAG: DUF1573 domain-containing protein [Sedimentisphaerales bacterium]|nr:DUF1573 domain-containing protein [Sedimentisphaerales bacterium]